MNTALSVTVQRRRNRGRQHTRYHRDHDRPAPSRLGLADKRCLRTASCFRREEEEEECVCVGIGGGRRGSTQGIQSRRGQCLSAKPHIPAAASSPSFSVGCHTLAAAVLWLPTACKRFRACYTGDRHDGAYLQAQDRSVTDGRKPATKRKRTHCVLPPFPSLPPRRHGHPCFFRRQGKDQGAGQGSACC